MQRRTMWRRLAVLAVAATAVAAGLPTAAGVAAGGGEPGGSLFVAGELVDNRGEPFGAIELQAEESDQPGNGGMFLHLTAPALSACDAHGPGADPGTTPLAEMECGGTGGVAVVVDGCRAILETHGIVHADHPNTVYLGPMTVDVDFAHDPRRGLSRVDVRIHTPKDVIRVAGTTEAPVEMETCT